MRHDAEWLRTIAEVAIRKAERHKCNDDVHTGLRELAFTAQAIALQIETAADDFASERPTQPDIRL